MAKCLMSKSLYGTSYEDFAFLPKNITLNKTSFFNPAATVPPKCNVAFACTHTHLLALTQLYTAKKLAKSGHGTCFSCESTIGGVKTCN